MDYNMKMAILNILTALSLAILLFVVYIFFDGFISKAEFEKTVRLKYMEIYSNYSCVHKSISDTIYKDKACMIEGYYYPDCSIYNCSFAESYLGLCDSSGR